MQPGLPLLPTEETESSSVGKTEASSPEHPTRNTPPRATEEEIDYRADMAQLRSDVKKREVLLYITIIAVLILSIVFLVSQMEKMQ